MGILSRNALPLVAALSLGGAAANIQASDYYYLMHPTANSVKVMVHKDGSTISKSSVQVKYRIASSNAGYVIKAANYSAPVNSSPTSYVYTVPLVGLSPGNSYEYQVSYNGGTTWQQVQNFKTAPAPGMNFTFASYSDSRDNTTVHNGIARAVLVRNPWMIIEAGDVAVDQAYANILKSFFVAGELELLHRVPLFMAPGNHEGWYTSQNSRSLFGPGNDAGTAAYPGGGSFDYGDMHLELINPYLTPYTGTNSLTNNPWNNTFSMSVAAMQAVRDRIVNAKKKWNVVVVHEPPFVSFQWAAGNNPDPKSWDNYTNGNKTMQTLFSNYLYNSTGEPLVDLIISGHVHFFQHVQAKPTKFSKKIDQLTIGAAGVNNKNFAGSALQVSQNNCTFDVVSQRSVQCYGIFDVTPTTFTARVYDYESGSEIKLNGGPQMVLRKSGGPPPAPDTIAPSVPTGLRAAAASSSSVQLNWSASTDNVGVTGYDVYRNNVKVTTTTAVNYLDTGLTANTAYSYKVQAKDAAGNVSAASVAATATTPAGPVTGSFVRRINMNGGATTIGGNAWVAYTTALGQGLSVVPAPSLATTAITNFVYEVGQVGLDANAKAMLNTGIWNAGSFTMNQTVPNGNYSVSLWVMENYDTNHRSFNVKIENNAIITGLGVLAKGAWRKYTYSTTVTDGQLNIALMDVVGEPGVMGLEIVSVSSVASIATFVDQLATWTTTSP